MYYGERPKGTFFKTPKTPKVARVKKQREGKHEEDKEMRAARKRDGYCRFPRCGCSTFHLVLDVAHFQQHRGMGGNPARDRTETPKLMTLCRARHRTNAVSVDRSTLRIDPLTKAGADGPCAFFVDVRVLVARNLKRPHWIEVGRETAPHVFEPFTDEQLELLNKLRGMEL